MTPLFDAIPSWSAIVPLAVYFVAIGAAHARGRPTAIGGVWDGLLLGAAVSGLVVVGPVALLAQAGGGFGKAVLLMLLAGLFVALGMLVSRPRLVIYNVTVDQVRPLVADIVAGLDPAARWAGSTAALPSRRFEVRIDGQAATRCVTLVSAGDRPNADGWGELCSRVRSGLRGMRVRSSGWAAAFLALGGGLLAAAIWWGVWGMAAPGFAAVPGPSSLPSPPPSQPGASDAGPRRSDDA